MGIPIDITLLFARIILIQQKIKSMYKICPNPMIKGIIDNCIILFFLFIAPKMSRNIPIIRIITISKNVI